MIRGELVNVRAVERTDAPDIFRWFNDAEVMRFWGSSHAAVSSNEVQRRIEGWLDEEVRLGRAAGLIVETVDEEPVGLVILSEYRPDHRSVALSLMIGERARWGEGLGTDALLSVVDACWAIWNLHRVWLRCESFNERAQRLYRRCGFVHEATLRDATFCDGQFHDVYVYGMLEPAASDRVASANPAPGGIET